MFWYMPFIQHKWLHSLAEYQPQGGGVKALGEVTTFGLAYQSSEKFLRAAEVALCSSILSGLPSW